MTWIDVYGQISLPVHVTDAAETLLMPWMGWCCGCADTAGVCVDWKAKLAEEQSLSTIQVFFGLLQGADSDLNFWKGRIWNVKIRKLLYQKPGLEKIEKVIFTRMKSVFPSNEMFNGGTTFCSRNTNLWMSWPLWLTGHLNINNLDSAKKLNSKSLFQLPFKKVPKGLFLDCF